MSNDPTRPAPNPVAQATEVDTCIYHGKSMNQAIIALTNDPALAGTLSQLIGISDYNKRGGVDTHELAASMVARAENPNASLTEIQSIGSSIYQKYEAQWRSEHPAAKRRQR